MKIEVNGGGVGDGFVVWVGRVVSGVGVGGGGGGGVVDGFVGGVGGGGSRFAENLDQAQGCSWGRALWAQQSGGIIATKLDLIALHSSSLNFCKRADPQSAGRQRWL